MISPTELRIGNLVINDHTKEVVPVTVMLLMVQYENSDGKWIDSNPIPITPEWLERLGFKLISDSIHIWNKPDESKDGYFLWSKSEGLSFSNYYHDYDAEIKFPHIKSVHQLQNLYYALTGQELKVKELTTTI